MKADNGTAHLDEEKETLDIRHNKHKLRKNNMVVAAMYEAYKGGMSAAKIGKLYGKSRESVYSVFRSRGYPRRTKKPVDPVVVDGITWSRTAKGGYYRGTLPGKRRILLHVYLWEKANGPAPAGHVIYHVDRNVFNNDISNLQLLRKELMGETFNKDGHNQFSRLDRC